ncbi:MAG: cytochrome-c peroxidase [Deltaproteobacteria bacterium]|nr:cytochrome-c peroxidase [Deltaproteobacteria bacterium]
MPQDDPTGAGDTASGDGGDDGTDGGDGGETGDETAGETQDDGPADGDHYPAEVSDALDLPWPPFDYSPALPAHFQTPTVDTFDNTPADNPLSDPGATLGRVLFYDVALSANETISCASCHAQADGFSDPVTLSEGFEGGLTGRNSMGLANARFYDSGHFFWDERAQTLEEQTLMPIQDPVEMGLTLAELVERVEAQPYYAVLFEDAFGDAQVDADRISAALAQFVRSIVSYRTDWDEGIAAAGNPMADFPNYSAQQNLGKQVFFGPGRCAPCHLDNGGPQGPPGMAPQNLAIFQITVATNNGLDAGPNDDNGVGDALDDPQRDGDFKSPSLRNVAQTAPYMHDGRFETLAEVVEHYDNGVQAHPNLDQRLRGPGGQPLQLGLDQAQKLALVAFLETLTDDALAQDPRWSDPFRD